MALSRTTASSAIGALDKAIYLASISGLSAGMTIKVDDEKMRVVSVPASASLPVQVFRGIEGTAVVAHPISTGVVFGLGDDFAPAPDLARRRSVASYSAAGAIALPAAGQDAVAIINGTALAMTLAAPSKANDGDMLIISSSAAAAHTVTVAGGLGGNTTNSDVLTFHATQVQAVALIAVNEKWQLLGAVAGAATVAGAGLA